MFFGVGSWVSSTVRAMACFAALIFCVACGSPSSFEGACNPDGTPAFPSSSGTMRLRGTVTEAMTGTPLANALVAVERGGLYLKTCDPSKGTAWYQYGARGGADGVFDLTIPKVDSGVHVFVDGHYYGSQLVRAADQATASFALEPETSVVQKPTLANASLQPASVATGQMFTITVDVQSPQGPLSDEILAIEPTTTTSAALDPPTAGTPGSGYPNGTYRRMLSAPATSGSYTYYIAATTEGCVTGDTTSLVLTVQ